MKIPITKKKAFPALDLLVRKAKLHNLKNIEPRFVSRGLNVVTGVSGAGWLTYSTSYSVVSADGAHRVPVRAELPLGRKSGAGERSMGAPM